MLRRVKAEYRAGTLEASALSSYLWIGLSPFHILSFSSTLVRTIADGETYSTKPTGWSWVPG